MVGAKHQHLSVLVAFSMRSLLLKTLQYVDLLCRESILSAHGSMVQGPFQDHMLGVLLPLHSACCNLRKH